MIVHISNDGGQAWRDLRFEDVEYGGVWDMVLVSEAGQDRLLLGLDRGGVYEVVLSK